MAGWVWPNGSATKMPSVNSSWNMNRLHPVYHVKMPHYGTDFHIPDGINRSVTDGIVERVGVVTGWSGGGYGVWVRNWDGSLAKYFHGVTGSAFVRVGQSVKAGDALSRTGMTGSATGVHLHLEISPRGGANGQTDPVPFLKARVSTAAPAATPVVVAPPVTVIDTSEEDSMGFYWYVTNAGTHYWFSYATGKSRPVSKLEWEMLRGVESGAAPRVDLPPIHRVGQGFADKYLIPTVA